MTHKLPEGTRCIIRREPLHPGAQRSLFPALDYRYWGFYTDREGDPVDLDATMRAHAHVEQHIQRLKDSGLLRFPFTNFEANANWMMAVAMAADLVRWFQLLCFDGPWVNARPKALRWGIFHAPGRLVHRSTPSASCASSTAGPAPTRCSTPTGASRYSADRIRCPPVVPLLDEARPKIPLRSSLTLPLGQMMAI